MKPSQQATIQALLERNTSQREIARITGIDRKTIRSCRQQWLEQQSNSPRVTTDGGDQVPHPWPPAPALVTTSLCKPCRDFIEAQCKLGRKDPKQFDHLSFLPGAEMQVDHGQGALTCVAGSD